MSEEIDIVQRIRDRVQGEFALERGEAITPLSDREEALWDALGIIDEEIKSKPGEITDEKHAVKSGGFPFLWGIEIADIGSAAAKSENASIFNWRLYNFLRELKAEFGSDPDAREQAMAVLSATGLAKAAPYHD